MGCRGVYFALTDGEVARLLRAEGDVAVMEVVQEEIEERWDEEWVQETDKAWDAMHRCLADGTLRVKGKSVLEKCVLGGRQLREGEGYIVSFLTAQEVVEVSQALEGVEQQSFRDKYFGLKKKFLWFNRSDYDGPVDEDDYEYTWSYFEETRAFFKKASLAGRAVIFTVDQ